MPIINDILELTKLKNITLTVIDRIAKKRLLSVNLSLSTLCHGNCIYCPKTRGKGKQIHNMPLSIAKKIADEVASNKFKEIHNVCRFSIGENGDALLNPDFIEIVRYLKKTNPNVLIGFNTNFQHLTKDISEVIIKEKLIDEITVNIDGHDNQSYFRVKGIPYNVVERNILDFLETRRKNDSDINLTIISITFAHYSKKIFDTFGKLPVAIKENLNINDSEDDFDLIKAEWMGKINSKTDSFQRSAYIFAWAERKNIKNLDHNLSNYPCPNLYRVIHECFIAPNGDWYACCFDDMQELILGNIINESINDVFFSKTRIEFLRLLRKREYQKIGYPCKFVEACQMIR